MKAKVEELSSANHSPSSCPGSGGPGHFPAEGTGGAEQRPSPAGLTQRAPPCFTVRAKGTIAIFLGKDTRNLGEIPLPISRTAGQQQALARLWSTRSLPRWGWEGKMASPLCCTVWRLLKRSSMGFPSDPAIPPPGLSPRALKTYVHTDTRR